MKKSMMMVLVLFSVLGLSAQSRIQTDVVTSKVLGRDVNVNVCMPRNFNASEKHYPVLYLLHGLYGNHTDWEARGGVRAVLDELTGTGEAAEMIIVMPCAGDQDVQHVQNGYFNMPGCPYEDFFFQDLIPAPRPCAPWPACRWAVAAAWSMPSVIPTCFPVAMA